MFVLPLCIHPLSSFIPCSFLLSLLLYYYLSVLLSPGLSCPVSISFHFAVSPYLALHFATPTLFSSVTKLVLSCYSSPSPIPFSASFLSHESPLSSLLHVSSPYPAVLSSALSCQHHLLSHLALCLLPSCPVPPLILSSMPSSFFMLCCPCISTSFLPALLSRIL